MKPSRYNTYISLEDGSYILFNELTGALLTVDQTTKDIIDTISEKWKEVAEGVLEVLTENGVVIEDNQDELLIIRYRYKSACYNPQKVSFVLAPTAKCNLSCCYCVQKVDESLRFKERQTATMSDSTVKGALSFLKNMTDTCNAQKLRVSFYGGEPLLAKPLMLLMFQDLAQWCEERSLTFETTISTNLTLLDQSFLDEIQRYAPVSFRTTLDGPEKIQNLYRHYKNGKGTYEHIVTNMGNLMDSGIRVRVQLNVNKYYRSMPQLFEDLKERGLTTIMIELYPLVDPFVTMQQAQKHYGILDKSFPLPESQFAVSFEEIPEARTFVYRAAFENGFKLPSTYLRGWSPCDGMRAYNFLVDPVGDVYKCVGSMLMKNLRVGHIHADGYFERYPFFHKWMDNDPTQIDKCQSCHHLPSCGGGCVVGRTLGNVPYLCEISHFPGEEFVKMYLKQDYPTQLQSLRIE